MNPERAYLRLPASYADYLGGVRWSVNDNVLEWRNGGCFLFTEQMADFLEGFASVRPVLHFALMTHLLALLRQPARLGADFEERERLWRAFNDSGDLRHAGAFFGHLCSEFPSGLGNDAIVSICAGLRRQDRIIHWSVNGPAATAGGVNIVIGEEAPPMPPAEFEAHVLYGLRLFDDATLKAWFTTGRGPLGSAADRLIELFPPSLSGRLAALLDRPRLAGARAFLPRLTAALALPPRRLARHQVALGGFADVTTRGAVHDLLLSQFALDELDFYRRYAEKELLYFRRDEPAQQTRQEMVVLLDQGVRTWGDVRLALAAAVLALGKQALQRRVLFHVATSTQPQTMDPVEMDPEAFGRLVEASDLSLHPGLALESVLETPQSGERDIVLLTHPFNLNEPDVRTAAKRLRPGERLFALTLDRHGAAELSELRRGVPVPVRAFKIDLQATEESPIAAPRVAAAAMWTGEVEPAPFPFHFGCDGVIRCFDFDAQGRCLLTASLHGQLHVWNLNGTVAEMLPRAVLERHVLQEVTDVLGVSDGFVVVGKLRRSRVIAAHYDFTRRHCRVHVIGKDEALEWEHSPGHHCLIGTDVTRRHGLVIDLGTGNRFSPSLGGAANRAQEAWDAWARRMLAPRYLSVVGGQAAIILAVDTGKLELLDYQGWKAFFTPLADGRPALRGASLLAAQWHGDSLAVLTSHGKLAARKLRVFRANGTLVAEHDMGSANHRFVLSRDGRLLARQEKADVRILAADGSPSSLGRTLRGGFSQRVEFDLGDQHLAIHAGHSTLYLDWSGRELRGSTSHAGAATPAQPYVSPDFRLDDAHRWQRMAGRRLLALSDRYGQIALFDAQTRLVCMFRVFRGRISGWLPDGSAFGASDIQAIGKGAVTERFAQVLRAASDGRET